ncbi:RNA polymerase sigma factor [Mucilaginibacter gotjawali]|uniref:RNA polymerase sigma factor (Sigma-70 family) n=1 Tax=Mucilaginibacter gotjawali TaxID=1550579 RepID=A0A839SJH0_9SPHI|nr:sigma-70 family RNA polymerase sigma factor [Mucilaginibacter gotjawali]MBB3056699.1 RNA polymerase sigma factor (sigma-70 family) [Mucilaginibacter gotjawali]
MIKASVNYSDKELIETLKQQQVSTQVIKYLYRTYFYFLSGYIKQNQGNDQDAEDIFQEVIVAFIEVVKAEKFRGESSIKTFLYTLNKFTWLNELKKRNRAMLRDTTYYESTGEEDKDVSYLLVEREAKGMVMAMMDKLGEVCKEILVAYYYNNSTMKEILQLVDYQNEQVLRNKKYKCLKSLEQMLTADPQLAQRFKNALTHEH